MNYKKIYNNIINNRIKNKYEGYTESHHILPKSLGGSDEKTNLVDLSAREHYICHLLLTKMFDKDSPEYNKMVYAYMMMCNARTELQERNYRINSRLYEELKKDHSLLVSKKQTGEGNSQFGTKWINNIKLRKSIKVAHDYILSEGWVLGRIINFDFLDRTCEKCGVNLNCKSNKELKTYCDECRRKPTKKLIEKLQNSPLNKKCYCDGKIYNSVSEASRILGLSYQTVQARIKSTKNEKYYYI